MNEESKDELIVIHNFYYVPIEERDNSKELQFKHSQYVKILKRKYDPYPE